MAHKVQELVIPSHASIYVSKPFKDWLYLYTLTEVSYRLTASSAQSTHGRYGFRVVRVGEQAVMHYQFVMRTEVYWGDNANQVALADTSEVNVLKSLSP